MLKYKNQNIGGILYAISKYVQYVKKCKKWKICCGSIQY